MTNETTLLNTTDTYRALQPFKTVDELNANTVAIREKYGDQLTRATYRVLDVLHCYACKFPGVSYRSKAKIAADLGISQRTVIRACNTLEGLGVIKQYQTKRKSGDKRQSSNAIVFIACHTKCQPKCQPEETPVNTPNQNIKDTYVTDVPELPKNIVVKEDEKPNIFDKAYLDTARMPEGWFDKASPYAMNAEDLYEITGTLYKAKKGLTIRIEDYVDEFGQVLREAWYKLKQGRIKAAKWHAYLFMAFRIVAQGLQRFEETAPLRRGIEAMFSSDYVSKPDYNASNATMDGYISVMFG